MTIHSTALTVLLDDSIREDDLEPLITAIRLLRHVADVRVIEQTGDQVLAYHHARLELRRKVFAALRDILD
jgi:hypothetical protein